MPFGAVTVLLLLLLALAASQLEAGGEHTSSGQDVFVSSTSGRDRPGCGIDRPSSCASFRAASMHCTSRCCRVLAEPGLYTGRNNSNIIWTSSCLTFNVTLDPELVRVDCGGAVGWSFSGHSITFAMWSFSFTRCTSAVVLRDVAFSDIQRCLFSDNNAAARLAAAVTIQFTNASVAPSAGIRSCAFSQRPAYTGAHVRVTTLPPVRSAAKLLITQASFSRLCTQSSSAGHALEVTANNLDVLIVGCTLMSAYPCQFVNLINFFAAANANLSVISTRLVSQESAVFISGAGTYNFVLSNCTVVRAPTRSSDPPACLWLMLQKGLIFIRDSFFDGCPVLAQMSAGKMLIFGSHFCNSTVIHLPSHFAFGGAIDLSLSGSAYVNVSRVMIDKSRSPRGGAISVRLTGQSAADISSLVCVGNEALQGGCLYIQSAETAAQPRVLVRQSLFLGNSAGFGGGLLISIATSANIQVQDSVFRNNDATPGGGGGLVVVFQTNGDANYPAHVSRCTFVGNRAQKGGAVYVVGGSLSRSGWIVLNNSAAFGGGVYIDGVPGTTFSSKFWDTETLYTDGGSQRFENNRATHSGGAIFISSTGTFTIGSSIRAGIATTFINNSAAVFGGAFYSEGVLGLFDGGDRTAVMMSGNSAAFGAVLAAVSTTGRPYSQTKISCNFNRAVGGAIVFALAPAHKVASPCSTYRNNSAAYGPLSSSFPAALRVAAGPSSGPHPGLPFSVHLLIADASNQPMVPPPSFLQFTVDFSSQSSVLPLHSLNGTMLGVDAKGLTLDDFVVVLPLRRAGATFTLTFSAVQESLKLATGNPASLSHPLRLSVNFTLQPCPIGTSFAVSSGGCIPCPLHSYSLLPDADSCHACPNGAACTATSVSALDGNWIFVDSAGVALVFPCLSQSCVNGSCSGHRQRDWPLCAKCEQGRSEWAGTCIECSSPNYLVIAGALALMTAYVAIQHALLQTSSSLVETMLFFVQVVQLICTSSYPWLKSVAGFLSIDLATSGFSSGGSSEFPCPFPLSPLSAVFLQVVSPLVMLLLLGVVLCLLRLLACVKCFKRRHSKASAPSPYAYVSLCAYGRTAVALSKVVFQNVCVSAFSYFNCTPIGNHQVIATQPAVDCGGQEYAAWIAFYFCLLLLVVAFPLLTVVALYLHKRVGAAQAPGREYMLGPLFEPFTDTAWYWAVVVLARRAAFAGCSTIGSRAWPVYPARRVMLLSAVACAFLCLHVAVRPFKQFVDNFADLVSLFGLNFVAGLFVYHLLVQAYPEDSLVPQAILVAVMVPMIILLVLIAADFVRSKITTSTKPVAPLADADEEHAADLSMDAGRLHMQELAAPLIASSVDDHHSELSRSINA